MATIWIEIMYQIFFWYSVDIENIPCIYIHTSSSLNQCFLKLLSIVWFSVSAQICRTTDFILASIKSRIMSQTTVCKISWHRFAPYRQLLNMLWVFSSGWILVTETCQVPLHCFKNALVLHQVVKTPIRTTWKHDILVKKFPVVEAWFDLMMSWGWHSTN